MRLRLAAFVGALVAACGAGAEEPESKWYLQVDNDVLFTTDRWYSSGVRVARSFPLLPESPHAWFLKAEGTRSQRFDVGVLHEIHAPESKRFRAGRTHDRAPVGRLFLAIARHDYAEDMHQTLELDAGVRGPAALGRQASDVVHEVIAGPRIDWSRQLPNRPDVQVAAVRTHRFPDGPNIAAIGVHYGAVVGNQVAFPHLGLELRAGDASSSIGATPLLRYAATPPVEPGRRGSRVSLFAGASARAVVHNRLLEHRPGSVEDDLERERVVVRVAAGVTWRPAWGVVSLAIAQDSREFAEQRTAHRFGSLSLHLDFF